jgi:hypothetical protein
MFGCSSEFWEIMSKAVTNIYGEVNPHQIITLIGSLNRENNLDIEFWQDLIEKIEYDYEALDFTLKVSQFMVKIINLQLVGIYLNHR